MKHVPGLDYYAIHTNEPEDPFLIADITEKQILHFAEVENIMHCKYYAFRRSGNDRWSIRFYASGYGILGVKLLKSVSLKTIKKL